jgi:hypothetical protein
LVFFFFRERAESERKFAGLPSETRVDVIDFLSRDNDTCMTLFSWDFRKVKSREKTKQPEKKNQKYSVWFGFNLKHWKSSKFN